MNKSKIRSTDEFEKLVYFGVEFAKKKGIKSKDVAYVRKGIFES